MEEDESSNKDSIISAKTETSNSIPFQTKSGRAIRKSQQYNNPIFETNLTATTYHNYYRIFTNEETQVKDPKIAAVGAAIGGGFGHTTELIPIEFEEVMT